MTTFLIIAAALVLIAPLFVAVPLLRRQPGSASGGAADETRHLAHRDQLAATGVPVTVPTPRQPRVLAVVASMAVPLLAVLLYVAIGNPAALRPQQAGGPHSIGQQQMDAMIEQLAARLKKNPQDAKGWIMLARAQTVLGRLDAAILTYANSVALFPNDAQLLADYADALAMANDGRLSGEPEQIVARALRADPDNAKALALAGTVAFDKQDFALAIKHWERLRNAIPAGSEFAKSIEASLAESRRLSLATADPRSEKTRTATKQ